MVLLKRLSSIGVLVASFSLNCMAYNPKVENLPNIDTRCNIKPDTQQCYVSVQLFYYNPDLKMCKSYNWGGCGDYAFDTLAECERSCYR